MAEEKVPVEKGEVSPVQMEEIKAGEFYTIQEIANKLRFSEAWITYLVQDGRIKGIKPIGGRWRIPRSEYERLTTQGIPPLPREKIRPAVTEIEVDEKLGGIITEEKPKKKKPAFPLDFSNLFGGGKE